MDIQIKSLPHTAYEALKDAKVSQDALLRLAGVAQLLTPLPLVYSINDFFKVCIFSYIFQTNVDQIDYYRTHTAFRGQRCRGEGYKGGPIPYFCQPLSPKPKEPGSCTLRASLTSFSMIR